MITRHGLDRQLGLGLESIEHARPQETLPSLHDFLVVDRLPGTHPGVTKALHAALKLQEATAEPANGSKWTSHKHEGCTVLLQYGQKEHCLYIAVQADSDRVAGPQSMYLEPCCPSWMHAVQHNARATKWHAETAAKVIKHLRRRIAEEVTGRSLQRIIVTGWHDGGALAQLLASYIPLGINCSADLRCITFDARRVMNLDLARAYEQLVPCSYNVLSGSDPLFDSFLCPHGLEVALMPRRPFGYVKHGRDPSFTWFPVNTPLLLSRESTFQTTLQHPWGEPQPLQTFIDALQSRSTVPCDLWAWLDAMLDAAAPRQKIEKLQSKLSLLHMGSHLGLPEGPCAGNTLSEQPQGPRGPPTAGDGLTGPQGPPGVVQGSPGALHGASGSQGPSTGTSGEQLPQQSPKSPSKKRHSSAISQDTGAAVSETAQGEAPNHGATLFARRLSHTASQLTAKLEGLSAKLMEHPHAVAVETGLPVGDAMKMERQVRGLEAQLRRQQTLDANVFDGEASPSSSRKNQQTDRQPDRQSDGQPDRQTATAAGADKPSGDLPTVPGDFGHVTVEAPDGQTDSAHVGLRPKGLHRGPSKGPARCPVSEAALTDEQLSGHADQSLLTKALLCSRVYPCLVAASAVYYQFKSFSSYTGLTKAAQVYDSVYNTTAYLGWIPETGTLLISFRGTSTWQDVVQDLKQSQQGHAFLYPWHPQVSVHTGFLQQLLGALGLHKEAKTVHTADAGKMSTGQAENMAAGKAEGVSAADAGNTSTGQAENMSAGNAERVSAAETSAQVAGVAAAVLASDTAGEKQIEAAADVNFGGNDVATVDAQAVAASDSKQAQSAGSTAGDQAATAVGAQSATAAGAQHDQAATAAGAEAAAATGSQAGSQTAPRDDTLLHAAAKLSEGAANVRCVIVTGHSLGGSVACLAAPLLACAYPSADVRCIAFGCPRVGNRQFACYFKTLVGFSARVVAGQDPITNMPTGQEPDYKIQHAYHHVPHLIHLDASGSLHGTPWGPLGGPLNRSFMPQHHLLRYYFHFVKPLAQTDGRTLWGVPQYQPRVLTLVDIEGDEMTEAAAKAAAAKANKVKEPLIATLKQQIEDSAWAQNLQNTQGFATLKQAITTLRKQQRGGFCFCSGGAT